MIRPINALAAFDYGLGIFLLGGFSALIGAMLLGPALNLATPEQVREIAVTATAAKADEARASLDQAVTIAAARPLFAPDRAPFSGATASAPKNPPASDREMPRLVGIVTIAGKSRALFEAGDASIIRAGIGEPVAGWTIAAISDGTARLERDGRTLLLSMDPRQEPADSADVKPALTPSPRPTPPLWDDTEPTLSDLD